MFYYRPQDERLKALWVVLGRVPKGHYDNIRLVGVFFFQVGGGDPRTIGSLALSYSTTEYAAPVWGKSPHGKNLDPELNQAWRSVTG